MSEFWEAQQLTEEESHNSTDLFNTGPYSINVQDQIQKISICFSLQFPEHGILLYYMANMSF